MIDRNARALLLAATLVLAGSYPAVFTPTAQAQTSKGILAGVVRDSSGALVPNATIHVQNEATGESRDLVSDANGEYRIDALAPGAYSVKVEAPGFRPTSVQKLEVKPSVVTSFDASLQAGSETTTVNVTANTNLINTENAQQAQTISTTELRNVPIFSLNPIELVKTAPGVQLVDQSNFSNGVNIQVNGSRPRANSFLIDGQDINDPGIAGQAVQPQIPDMYQNVTIITNSATAEFGGAGGGIVNLITRGGTNQFHGTAWELYSGSGINALDGQQRQLPHEHGLKSRFNQHQFGFTLGGPVLKNKVFAFGGTQFSRIYGNETAAQNLLPDANGIATLQRLSGQYPNAKLLLGLLDNGTYVGTFRQNTTIPVTHVDLGSGRGPIELAQFQRPPVPQQNPDTQWTYRVDWLPRPSDTLYIRYLHDNTMLTPDFFNNPFSLPGFDTQQGGTSEQFGGNWIHVFSPRLLNEFRVSETRTQTLFDYTPEAAANPLAKYPTITFNQQNSGGFPALGAPGAISVPQGSAQDIYQFQDTVAITKGQHTLRVGADIGRSIIKENVPFNYFGSLTFNQGGGFSDIGNFIDNYLGPSGQATINFGSPRVDPHAFNQAYFAQDDFKFSPQLTLNLGVRYEYRHNPENSLEYPAIDPFNPFLPINTKIRVDEDYNNIAPRLGVAFAPQNGGFFGNGRTVYHAGYGIFYDFVFTNIVDNSQASAPNTSSPLATSTQGRGIPNATSAIAGLSPVIDPFSTVELVNNNLVNPQTHEWNLGFEHQLPANLKWDVSYVGARGEKLFANQQFNYFDPNTGERLNPDRGAIITRGNYADSIFHGVTTDISHDFSHGLFVRGTYTYGKAMDDGSEVFVTFNQATSYAANLAPGGRAGEWSRSAWDHRHYLGIQYVYELPGYSGERVLSLITKNWTIAGDTILQSGPPSTLGSVGFDTNGDGSAANDRPTLSNPHAPLTAVGIDGVLLGATSQPGTYFDVATANQSGNLVPVAPGSEHFLVPVGSGNIRRNSYNQPGLQFWNVSVQKDIPAGFTHLEGATFQIRAEAQDVGNHNNVEPVDTNVLNTGLSSYLNRSQTRSNVNNGALAQGRVMRFWAKFSF
jgi:carboxypeptidase family protein/TonB-dependent receptor-like protein